MLKNFNVLAEKERAVEMICRVERKKATVLIGSRRQIGVMFGGPGMKA